MSNNVRSITEPRHINTCEECTFVLGTFFPEGTFITGPLGVDIFIHPRFGNPNDYDVVFIKEDGLYCGCVHCIDGKLSYNLALSSEYAPAVEAFMRQVSIEYRTLFNAKHKEIRNVSS